MAGSQQPTGRGRPGEPEGTASSGAVYVPTRPSRTETVDVRAIDYSVRLWGEAGAPMLVLLHGGRDASITFQFLVDALARDWFVVAPDWRGHGRSGWAAAGYWFHDYLADLDALLEHYAPGRPARLVGHSLGGNVACLYASARPERVSRVVSLDGFGIPEGVSATAPDRLRRWLDGVRTPPAARVYGDLEDMAARLRHTNPKLALEKARFLAEHLSRRTADGRLCWRFDPRHRLLFPTVHHFADWAACFARVAAPVLWVASDSQYPPALVAERMAHFREARQIRLAGTSHNLHHDEPAAVAALVEDFLATDEAS